MIEKDEMIHISERIESIVFVEFDQNTHNRRKIDDFHRVKCNARLAATFSANDSKNDETLRAHDSCSQ